MIIRRKYPELEQKEFGIVSGTKKLINKTRRNLAAKALKSAKKDIADQYNKSEELAKNLKNSSKRSEIMKNLGKEAEKRGASVLKGRKSDKEGIFNADRMMVSDQISTKKGRIEMTKFRGDLSRYRKLGKALIKGKYVIINKTDQSALAHELGHIDNKSGKISKHLVKLREKNDKNYNDARLYRKGIKGILRNLRDGNVQIMEEEKKEAKRNMKDALDDYKYKRNIGVKSALYKTLKQNKL